MDREKVIKGLECHQIDNNHRINCTDCPYYVDDDSHIRCVNDLHDDAIELLKEQDAVEPTLMREGRNKYCNDYVCPRCDNEVVYEQNYCSECGIPFLWKGR